MRIALLIIVVSACAAAGCGDWPWRHDMTDQQSRSISSSARPPAPGTIPVTASRGGQPATASADSGRPLYDIYCLPCHGSSFQGDGPVARYFKPMRDLTSADVQQHDDQWFYGVIVDGVGQMPRFAYELSPDERWQIVAFLRRAGAARTEVSVGGTR